MGPTVGESCYNDPGGNCSPIITQSSEIKCSEITLIKYKPIVECGKVDVYNRSQGIITSVASSIFNSTDHGLNYGDVIKTVGALRDKALNGVFYVGEIITEHTFKLYKEQSLSTPIVANVTENIAWCKIDNNTAINKNKTINGIATSATSLTLTSAQVWSTNALQNYQIKIIAGTGKNQVRTISSNISTQVTVTSAWSITPDDTSIFTIYGGESATWNHYATIFSPRGKNGYSVVLDYPDEDALDQILLSAYQGKTHTWVRESSILSCFNSKRNFDEILMEDYFADNSSVSYLPANDYYVWNHYKRIPYGDDASKYASLIDLFTLFPVSSVAILNGQNDILTGRPISTYDSYLDNINIKYGGKIRSLSEADYGIGDLWNSAYNLVNGFKFGCSIDLKKDEVNDRYLLLVGERGCDTVISTAAHYYYPDDSIKQIHPWSTLAPVASTYLQLPQYIHGAAFLFDIQTDSKNNINQLTPGYNQSEYSSGISLSDWFTAYKNDPTIAKPRPLTFKYENYNNPLGVPNMELGFAAEKDLRSISIDYYPFNTDSQLYILKQKIDAELAKCPGNLYLYNNQEVFNDFYDWVNIESKETDEYWYGGMIYGLADINNGATYLTNLRRYLKDINEIGSSSIFAMRDFPATNYVGGDCDPDGYFSDLIIPKIKTAIGSEVLLSLYANYAPHIPLLKVGFFRNGFDIYPYVDSFGKSVALDIVDSNIYVFASSKVKPYVYRPDAGDIEPPGYFGSGNFGLNTCRSSLLPYCYCGYIHVFENSTKTQKIFDDSTSVVATPSLSWTPQYYKAEKFANCMIAKNSQLYWGQPKPIEISSTEVSWVYEKSKIFIYSLNELYDISDIIINENDRSISYLVNTASGKQASTGELTSGIGDYKDSLGNRLIKYKNIVPDFKEYFLRNKLDSFYVESKQASTADTTITSIDQPYYFYPSDRFGAAFKVDRGTLIANAFDDRNELGDLHTQIRWPYTVFANTKPASDYYINFNKTLDYLHVYQLFDNIGWKFIQKIAPAFNKEDSKYGYYTLNTPANVPNSIRSLNNITYDNNSQNSITWDIDLTGSYDLADNRIIIKDPITISLFEKNTSIPTEASNSVPISYKSIPLNKYFTYSEDFEALYLTEDAPCSILFNRVNSLYNYDYFLRDNKPVIYKSITQADGDKFLKITTPVYFINIPSRKYQYYSLQSITIVVEEIVSSSTNPPLDLVVYKTDPRTTVYPYYTLDSQFCLPPESAQDIKTKTVINKFLPYRGGASDLGLYEEGSFENPNPGWASEYRLCQDNQYQSTCLAKYFAPVSTTSGDGRRINTYTINLVDLNFDFNDYIKKESLILTTTRNFTVNPSLPESLSINDLENIGYDSSLPIDESLIIGFSFGNNLFQFTDLVSYDYESDIRISRIDAQIKHSSPPAGSFSLRKYICSSAEVPSFSHNPDCFTGSISKIFNFYDGKNQELPIKINNEIIGGPVLKNTKSLLGSSQSSLLPALNDTQSEILSGTFCKSVNLFSIDQYGQYGFSYEKSFDIHKVDPFTFYMSGSTFVGQTKESILFLKAPEGSSSGITFYTETGGPINEPSTLFIKGPINDFNFVFLNIKSTATVSSPYLDYPTLFINCTYFQDNNTTLHMKALQPVNIPLHIAGPIRFADGATLILKGLTAFNNAPLFIKAFASLTNSITLLLKADIALSPLGLYTAGPIALNSRQPSIYDSCSITDRSSLFDISNSAEDEIVDTNRNSIASNKYSIDEDHSYAVKEVDPKNALATHHADGYYRFYFQQRDNKSIAANDNYLCIGTNTNIDAAIAESAPSDTYPLPKLQIFELNEDEQASLMFTYDNIKNDLETLDIPSDETYFVANITCLDISDNNRIAASVDAYAYYFDQSGFIKVSATIILEKIENTWQRVAIISQSTIKNPTLLEEAACLTGLYLQWVNEDLYFTQNNQNPVLDQIKVAKLSNVYIPESLAVNLTKTDLYTSAFISNIDFDGFLEKIHYGFGHKFIISGDLMFVSCPLIHPYYSLNDAASTAINSFYGCVFIFKYTTSWTFVSTIYHNGISGLSTASSNSFGAFASKLFGYDIAYNTESQNLLVGQPGSNSIYRFLANTSGWSSLWSTTNLEENFGSSVDLCNMNYVALSNINKGRIYYDNNNSYFEYDDALTLNEITEYKTPDVDISSYSETLVNFKVIHLNGSHYILAMRKFNVEYEDSSFSVIQKVSLLNFDRLFRGSLFLKTYDRSNALTTLYTQGPSFINDGMRLRLFKPYGVESNTATLFISTRTLQATPLFMASVEPDLLNSGSTLFTYGTTAAGVGIYNKPSTLFIKAKDSLWKDGENNTSLFITAPLKDGTVGSMPLFLSYPILNYSDSSTLFIDGNTSGLASKSLQSPASLYIKSFNNGFTGDSSCSLFVYQKEGGTNLNLFMCQESAQENIPLHTRGILGSPSSGMSLVFQDTNPGQLITLQINGFRR